jgi:hypothetical protein
MARENYPLSDETFKVLSGHIQEFAAEADKDVSYFNKIKNGVEKDPYSHFRALFRIGCRTGAPVDIWLQDLQGIYVRSRRLHVPLSELSEKILEKVETDSDALHEILAAIKDRQLTKAERHSILAKLARNKETNDAIEQIVLANLGEISETEERRLKAV